MSTCRICHNGDYESLARGSMVRVGPRHSVHVSCKFEALKTKEERIAWVESLPSYTWRNVSELDFDCGLEGTFEFLDSIIRRIFKVPPHDRIREERS